MIPVKFNFYNQNNKKKFPGISVPSEQFSLETNNLKEKLKSCVYFNSI